MTVSQPNFPEWSFMKTEEQTSFSNYMKVAALCEYLSITNETVYRWIKTHNLPARRVGKQWLFKREEIDTWLENCTKISIGKDEK